MSDQGKTPNIQRVTRTTVDLKIIQQQLDDVESAMLMAWNYIGRAPHSREHNLQMSDAIDKLLAVKKSLGLKSDLIPVKEQQKASFTEYI